MTGKSAWYRWMYAYANYVQANEALRENKIKEAGVYFKISYAYSTDLWARGFAVYYYRDMIFMLKREEYFEDVYFDYLSKYSDNKEEALKGLLASALLNPDRKEKLRTFYDANFPDREGFDSYWLKSVNQVAKVAPDITLETIGGDAYSLAGQKGKWVLIDFWGTWCGPCREDHPTLEKFYQSITTSVPDKISLITVACRDYVPISVDINWVDFVKDYVGLSIAGEKR